MVTTPTEGESAVDYFDRVWPQGIPHKGPFKLYLVTVHKGSATHDFLAHLSEDEVETIHEMGDITLWPMEIIVNVNTLIDQIMALP